MQGMMPLGMHMDNFMASQSMGGVHGDCERRLSVMAETIERERATIQVLESKCDEYLTQLQRSADIIEMSREREDRDRQRYAEKEDDMEERLEDERARRQAAEEERDRLRREMDRIRDERGEGEGEAEKVREALYKKELTVNEQKIRVG